MLPSTSQKVEEKGSKRRGGQETKKTKTNRGSRRESRGGAGRKERKVLHVLVFGLLPSKEGSLSISAGLAERGLCNVQDITRPRLHFV